MIGIPNQERLSIPCTQCDRIVYFVRPCIHWSETAKKDIENHLSYPSEEMIRKNYSFEELQALVDGSFNEIELIRVAVILVAEQILENDQAPQD